MAKNANDPASQITKTQARYLSFIHAYREGFGLSPAQSEIAEALEVASPSAHLMLKTLEKKGFISREPGVARSVKILVPPDVIPRWKKTITRTQWVWAKEDPNKHLKRMPGAASTIYRIKITLDRTKPPIWRRIETEDLLLEDLHELIQAAMGWENAHMHCFGVGKRRYLAPEFADEAYEEFGEASYEGVRISDLVNEFGSRLKFKYEYDFGDSWEHTIKLEKIVDADPAIQYPHCTAGANACPPEDIGGVWGFYDFVEAISDPEHEQYAEFMEWNESFDPERFDPEEVSQRVRERLPAW